MINLGTSEKPKGVHSDCCLLWKERCAETRYYTHHHGILTSNKFRVVFNASAKSSTVITLNDAQMVGEKLQRNLWIILLINFRKRKYGMTADIGKMYRQAPHYGWPKLKEGYHEIFSFNDVNGRYGREISVDLKYEKIYPPQYMGEKLDEEDVRELNDSSEKLFLFFGGRHPIKQ